MSDEAMRDAVRFEISSFSEKYLRLSARSVLEISEDIRSETNNIEVVSGENYYDAFNTQTDFYQMKLSDFLDQPLTNPPYGPLCSETPLSRTAVNHIQLDVSSKMDNEGPTYSLVHAGLRGATTPVHFDWDFCWVINASLSGSKLFQITSPENGWFLSPMHNISSLDISGISQEDRSSFLQATGGKEFHVGKGQALLFPSIWWHGAVYSETSTAISVRFGGPKHLRPLAVLPRHWLLQRVAWAEWCSDDLSGYFEWLEALLTQYFLHPEFDWEHRRKAMLALYRERLLALGLLKGSQYLTGSQYDLELLMMSGGLEQLYQPQTPPQDSYEHSKVEETVQYIFEARPSLNPVLKEKTARFALSARQGLRPSRGLISCGIV